MDSTAAEAQPEVGSVAPHYTAGEVAKLCRLAPATVYEFAKREPDRFGVVKYGRAVRFRKSAIDKLINGNALHVGA